MSTQTNNLPAKSNNSISAWLADPWSGLWNNWFSPSLPSLFPQSPTFRTPAVDVYEGEKQVTVKAEVPGMSEKDLDISHEDGVLYLKGEKKGEEEEKKNGSYYRESWSGSFSRAISLGNDVDWGKVDAKFKDGVLTVTLPRTGTPENRKKIPIHKSV